MQKQAFLLALFAIICSLFVSTTIAAADDKEAYGTGMYI